MATINFRVFEKKILRGLLSDDKLEQLQAQLREITTDDAHKDLLQAVLLNAGRLADYRNTMTRGTTSSEDLRVLRNQLRMSFLNIIDDLPDEMSVGEDPSVYKPKLMSEQTFKSWVLRLIAGGKLFLIAATFVFGGFTNLETVTVLFLLLPTLMMRLGVILGDISRRRNDLFPTGNDRKTVSATMKRTTFGLIGLYLALMLLLIDAYARGYISDTNAQADFKSLVTWLGILECVFGVYLGQIVYGLFKEK
jgi:Effector-associated domain 11